MTTNQAIVELRERRERREDYAVTFLVVVLCIGFIIGMTVGALITSRQDNRYEPQPRNEMFHEQPLHS